MAAEPTTTEMPHDYRSPTVTEAFSLRGWWASVRCSEGVWYARADYLGAPIAPTSEYSLYCRAGSRKEAIERIESLIEREMGTTMWQERADARWQRKAEDATSGR